MNVEILNIHLADRLAGKLFRFDNGTTQALIRYVADEKFALDKQQKILSLGMRAASPDLQTSFWFDIKRAEFNGQNGRLPTFFQNMLPEGLFRTQLAQERGCREDDHFGLFAACGLDLPGAIKALPANVSRTELAHLITQDQDALEMSVTADPLPFGVSISGMQPKLGLIEQGGRYVARKRVGSTRIIGKLPQVDSPMLPEVEHLSLTMAAAAGATVCTHKLEPLTKLSIKHGYTLGGSSNFLAVTRFDRDDSKRIHCEDFAQALNIDPQNKYTGATYAAMAGLMMRFPESLGVTSVHELLRLITINELLGNYDAHLKNFCLIYPDGKNPVLAPAFDIVAWTAYISGQGNALSIYRDTTSPRALPSALNKREKVGALTALSLREFCNRVGIVEKPCAAVIKATVSRAIETWPVLIERSSILATQKEKVLKHFYAHPFVQQQLVRKVSKSS